jgi:hypothetical protein
MAESISEGTLKQFSKRRSLLLAALAIELTSEIEVGDFVERDEEIATIETDKARHATLVLLVVKLTVGPRLMYPSMLQRLALSRSSSQTKKIP